MKRYYLPTEPLVRLVAAAGGVARAIQRAGVCSVEVRALRRLYERSVQAKRFTPGAADRLAIRLFDLHPALVWGETWWTPPRYAPSVLLEPRPRSSDRRGNRERA